MKCNLTQFPNERPRFKIGLFLLCFCFSNAAFAQDEPPIDEPNRFGMSVGVSAGTSAILGVDIAATLLPSLGIRAGYNYLEFSKESFETSLNKLGVSNSNTPFLLDGNLELNTVQFWLEYMPGEAKLLRIQAGFAVAMNNKVDVQARFGETVFFNDLPVPPENLGDMTITYTSNKILPYLGLGFGHAVPEKLLTFSLEAGAYYRGAPTIEIVGTELFAPNSTNENGAIISENASKYKIQPVLALRLGIRIIK